MRYGISAATIILKDQQVLLVHHYRKDAFDFWVPPGGSLIGSETIFECASRETYEETGLSVELDKIVYIQEFVEGNYHFCKFFILGKRFDGDVSIKNRPADEDFLVDAGFFSKDELTGINVMPEILKDRFWIDAADNFPVMRYLGLECIG